MHLTVQNASHAARHGAAVLRIMLHQQYAQRRHAAISQSKVGRPLMDVDKQAGPDADRQTDRQLADERRGQLL